MAKKPSFFKRTLFGSSFQIFAVDERIKFQKNLVFKGEIPSFFIVT